MAEAAVEERPPVPNLFYCHMCNVEINIPNTEFVCPLCAGGFVEQLPGPLASSSDTSASSSASSVSTSSGTGNDGLRMIDVLGGNNRASTLDAIRHEITALLMSRNPPNVEISFEPGNNRRNIVTLGGNSNGGNGGTSAGGRVRAQNLDRLDNVLIDFLQSISGDIDGAFGNSQMFFMGNPGDYAWGREGIDTIVTQLLNQMETSGPPPLPKEKIEEIPTVSVTSDDIDKKLQCSVCWEDFRVGENVRKLPCTHIYHENCIVPWLDLHGTCPICRKSLTDEFEDANSIEMGMAVDGPDCPMHGRNAGNIDGRNSSVGRGSQGNNVTSTSNRHATRRNTNATATSQTENPRDNNVFGFDNANVDLD